MEMTILEKIEKATDNVPKVYNSGYRNGFKAGSAAGGGSSGVDEASILLALQEVVDLQDSLISEKLEFTLNNDVTNTHHILEFKEGMTWGEWIESNYNTMNFILSSWGAIGYIDESDNMLHPVYYSYEHGQERTVAANDLIEADHLYIIPY